MSLLHCKEICVIRSQISSKSYKHARVLISSNLKINVVNRLPVFLVLATPPKLKARKSIWSVALLIMQYLYLSWPLKCSLWVLESRVTSRFQIQRTNDSQKGAVLLNVGRLSSRTPYFKRCQCSRGDFIDFNICSIILSGKGMIKWSGLDIIVFISSISYINPLITSLSTLLCNSFVYICLVYWKWVFCLFFLKKFQLVLFLTSNVSHRHNLRDKMLLME